MRTRYIEATNRSAGGYNWGRFMIGVYDTPDWAHRSVISGTAIPFLTEVGHDTGTIWVSDLVTGEGAAFHPPGNACADLEEHEIWVSFLFEPFLVWLYTQDPIARFEDLPDLIDLDAPSDYQGYRRPGPRS